MNAQRPSLLIVEDEAAHVEAIRRAYEDAGVDAEIRSVATLREFRASIRENRPDLVLIDLNLPDGRAVEVLTHPPEDAPFPILVMTAFGNQQIVVDVMKAGALDYVVKSPAAFATLPRTVERALREWGLLQKRKRIEAALRESEQRYHAFIESTTDMAFVKNEAGRYLLANGALSAFFGRPAKDILGRVDGDLMPPEAAEQCRASDRKVLASGGIVVTEERVGGRRYETRKFPISLDGGRIGVGGFIRDVTERAQAEELLRASEEKFRAIANYTVDWESWFGVDGKYLWVNPSVKRFTGYSAEEVLAMPDFIPVLIAAEDREEFTRRFRDALRGGQGDNFEFRYLHKDGGTFWLSVSWRPIYDAHGNALGVRTSGYDITQRKRTDEYREMGRTVLQILSEPGDLLSSIRRVLAELKTRTGANAVGIRLQDGDDYPYFVQDGFPRDFLQTGSTMVARGADSGLCRDADGRVRLECICGLVISGTADPSSPFLTPGGSFWTNDSFPLLDLQPDQEPRFHPRSECLHQDYASVALVPIRNKDRIVGLIHLNDRRKGFFALETVELLEGIASHIGEVLMRRRAEDALRESQGILQAVLNSIPVRVFWKDRNLVFLGCNTPFARDAGFEKPEDVIGKDDHAMAWREQAGQYRADDQAVIRSGEARLLFEETHASATGAPVHLLVSKLPLRDAGGAIIGLLGTYEDITDLKRAEEAREQLRAQLNQAQKMESVGRLAGGVAHDFNNKLQVILGSVEMLLEKLPPDDTSRPVLLEVQTAARRSADLTRQLLAFSRKQTISPVVLDLGEAVANSLKMLGRLIGENIRLSFAASTDPWPVLMDRGQLDQVLANLAINARDAISGSGTISIESANRTLRDADCRDRPDFVGPGDFASLTFRDDGGGMPADVLAHIFEPFFTTKEVGKGTGLGLATVYGIVKQNNGAISAESEPGRGTTFTILLPRSQVAAHDSGEEPETRIPTGTETILLTEDEAGVLDLIRKTLTQQGYRVLTASTPRLALQICEVYPEKIDLLLTDVIMPIMSGKVLADRVRGLRPDIRVLFMSGYTAEAMRYTVRLPEDLHVLQKPFSRADLAQRVRNVLDSPPAPPPSA